MRNPSCVELLQDANGIEKGRVMTSDSESGANEDLLREAELIGSGPWSKAPDKELKRIADLIRRLADALRVCEEEKGKLGRYRQEIQAALNGEKMVVGCSEEGVRIEQAKQEVERLKGELGRALERERSAVEVSRYWNKMWNQERQRVQELREAVEVRNRVLAGFVRAEEQDLGLERRGTLEKDKVFPVDRDGNQLFRFIGDIMEMVQLPPASTNEEQV